VQPVLLLGRLPTPEIMLLEHTPLHRYRWHLRFLD